VERDHAVLQRFGLNLTVFYFLADEFLDAVVYFHYLKDSGSAEGAGPPAFIASFANVDLSPGSRLKTFIT